MKQVTARSESVVSARRIFRQLLVTLAASTAICSVQAAPQGAEALGSKLTPLGARAPPVLAAIFQPGHSQGSRGRMELRPGTRGALEVQG